MMNTQDDTPDFKQKSIYYRIKTDWLIYLF